MNPHFRAFSFVDQITRMDRGGGARGRYTVPRQINEFPISLAAEAVGQLAAWAAMAAMDFRLRPVAGIAGRVDFFAPILPGMVLELAADLKTADSDAVSYDGDVRCDGEVLVQLENCVGPMVQVRDFDDPAGVRSRFDLLCAGGAPPGAFKGIPVIPLTRTGGEPGRSITATLVVPAEAPFFHDHFPRRPVFPGTLQIQANIELASWLARELPPATDGMAWKPRSVTDVKLRTFIAPNDHLELEARLSECDDVSAVISLQTRKMRRLAGSARVLLKPQ